MASSYLSILFKLTQASAALIKQITYSLLTYVYLDRKSFDYACSINWMDCLNLVIDY